jgi:hypothetical protein
MMASSNGRAKNKLNQYLVQKPTPIHQLDLEE